MTLSTPQPPPKSATPSALIRVARTFGRPYLAKIGLIFGFLLLEAGMTGALAYLLDPAIRLLFLEKNADYLVTIPLAIFGVMSVKAALAYAGNVTLAHVALRMIGDLQTAMFEKLMRFDLARLNAIHSGQFASSFLNDVTMLRDTIARGMTGLARDVATLIGLGAVMYYQDWRLALVATTILPLAAFSTLRLGDKTAKAAVKSMSATGDLATHISEALAGKRVIKAYGMESAATERAGGLVDRRFKFLMKGTRAKAAATPSAEALAGLGIAAVVAYAGYQGIYGTMGLNNFMSFLAAMMLSYQSIRNLSSFYSIMAEGEAAAQRTFGIMDTPLEIVDAPGAPHLDLPKGKAPSVVFDAVTFNYRPDAPALDRMSFEAPAGKTVALVGPSGSGKSTVLNLLLRFYDVGQGEVRIGGQPIRDVTLASLRDASALVTQEPFLFDDTIRANIAVGRPGATDAEILAAARAAAADGFIAASPDGLDTIVGEGGLRLSGGQRQRIAIARAMLKDAPILLLDEATSALDSASERDVQAALKVLMKGRTTLVVAHRLSTVLDADLIVVVDQGRIAEQGTHSDLLARGGLYARLYRTQSSEREPSPAAAQ